MIEIGKINKLTVLNENASGYYLGNEDEEEIFMPAALGPELVNIDDELEVFVYLDTTDSLIATTKWPNATVDEFAYMEAVEVTNFGAFMNWGIDKDLLVPDTEQRMTIRIGEKHLVRVCLDERTDRVYGTTKTGKYIAASEFDIFEHDKVKLIPFLKEKLGYRVIINRKFIGMIYHNEIYTDDVVIGKETIGYIRKLRNDGLVDCCLRPIGKENRLNSKDVILEFLLKNGGSSSLCDKSSPESIKKALGMSKKSFKSAIGTLYKEKSILINKDGIEILKKS